MFTYSQCLREPAGRVETTVCIKNVLASLKSGRFMAIRPDSLLEN